MANIQFIDLAAQQKRIRSILDKRIAAVLDHGQYIGGPEITELEDKLKNYVGVKHALTCANGSDALQIALMALGIGPGDEVITPAFTFFATAEMIALVGANPVFVDIDPVTYNIDPQLIEAAITEKTRAIMPVSLYGQCPDIDAINAIAVKHKLPVIEDGAQSFGATYKGRKSCGLTTIGCTSFFPSKPLGCYGDGGAIFTNDDELAQKMKWVRSHGQERRYFHRVIGINSRLDTLQAAILLAKLEVFAEEVELRGKVGAHYTELLKGTVKTPVVAIGNTHVYAQYTIEVDQRDQVQKALNELGVPTAVHYPLPLNRQPAMAYLGKSEQRLPHSDAAAARVLSLPMHPYLSENHQFDILSVLKSLRADQKI